MKHMGYLQFNIPIREKKIWNQKDVFIMHNKVISHFPAVITSISLLTLYWLCLQLTGGLLLTGNGEGQLYIINKETGDPEVAIRAHEAALTRVAFHSGHIFTASASVS